VKDSKWGWLWGSGKEEEQKDKKAEQPTSENEPVQIDLESEETETQTLAPANAIRGSRWAPILEMPIETLNGEEAYLGMVRLNPNLFLESIRTDILNRVVVWQLAARRQGSHKTKDRSEVRGGGRKPHPQKGTGRARVGSIRSPSRRGGGHAHAIRPRSYYYPLQAKVRLMGLRVALSVKYAQGKLRIIKNTEVARPKTKVLVTELKKKGWNNAFIVDGKTLRDDFKRASGNLGWVKAESCTNINVYDILSHDLLVLSLEALEYCESALLRSAHNFYEFQLLPGAPSSEDNNDSIATADQKEVQQAHQ